MPTLDLGRRRKSVMTSSTKSGTRQPSGLWDRFVPGAGAKPPPHQNAHRNHRRSLARRAERERGCRGGGAGRRGWRRRRSLASPSRAGGPARAERELASIPDRIRPPPDTVWIDALSREGRWVIISGDRRITRNRAEYAAFRSSRLVGFFLFRGLYKAPVAKQTDRHLVGERLLRAGVKLHIMRTSAVSAIGVGPGGSARADARPPPSSLRGADRRRAH